MSGAGPPTGYLLLVLHGHLPFIRHPEHDWFLEERWLFEAITECYLPLLTVCERLRRDGVPYRLTLSLSPPLISMLQDPLLQARYLRHVRALIELADAERQRQRGDPALRRLADYYLALFTTCERRFRLDYAQDLVAAFGRLERAGGLEIITSAATHGFLPLYQTEPTAVRAQIEVARDLFEQRLGHRPQGIWLPECGYFPGLEEALDAAGLRYFFLETHGIEHARPRPPHGVSAPVALANGLAAFGRDPACSESVWSSETGYPGHPLYREFHRDIGFERDARELGALAVEGAAAPVGIKYRRVTSRDSGDKALYDPAAAQAQARRHAADFVSDRVAQLGRSRLRDRPALLVAPFDAELFGHWWFEGPCWLEHLVRCVARTDALELLTAGDYLTRHPVLHRADPQGSTWGAGGYSGFWMNDSNAWLLPHLHQALRGMRELAVKFRQTAPDALTHRALNQAGRELLLAQASDWPFIMRTGTAVDYAVASVKTHLSRFAYLQRALSEAAVDEQRLAALEQMDNIFPDLDYRVYAG